MKENLIGVIHGRFQGLHWGHIEYLLEAKKRCDFLYIGITNPDTMDSKNSSLRNLCISNPFYYYERMEMLIGTMIEQGIKREEFEVVPFPINTPDKIKYYTPFDALFFTTIYDEWNIEKIEVLKSSGVKIEVMWERSLDQKPISGTLVRERIVKNENWAELVPRFVYQYINSRPQLIERLINLYNSNDKI